jgi:phage terminase large subunit
VSGWVRQKCSKLSSKNWSEAAGRRLAKLQQSTRSTESAGDIERWRKDPVAFAREALGRELTDYQAKILLELTTHHRVAVRSGHKSGKTLLDGIAALWWYAVMPHAGVVITAPTDRQVRRVVWREIRSLVHRAREIGRASFPSPALDPGTGIQSDDGRYIVGFSTTETENMGGFSGPAMLFIGDEASGIAEPIFEAIIGNTAGGAEDDPNAVAKILLTGNPTQTSGTFYAAFHGQRKLWRCHNLSAFDSPNVRAGRVVVPGLATAEYVARCKIAWGEDSDLYRVRVLGEFPKGGGDQIIPLGLIEAAIGRDTFDRPKRLELGVDCARFGDDLSVVAPRRGQRIYELRHVNGLDEEAVAGLVIATARDPELRLPGEPRPLVKIDAIGVGAGVASVLRPLKDHNGDPLVDILPVDVAQPSDDEEEFYNMRTQLWFGVAAWLKAGGSLPDDDYLSGDLAAPKYGFDLRGRRKAEKKEDFKKRLGHSPDRGDAVTLAIYSPASHRAAANDTQDDDAYAPSRWGSARGFG